MKTFEQRLQWCMRNGNLRVADLARWFGRPHGTVRGWALPRNNRAAMHPSGSEPDVEHVHRLLELLELMIRKKAGFPLALGLTPSDRRDNLMGIRAKVMEAKPAAE
jgi:hypothetical protein